MSNLLQLQPSKRGGMGKNPLENITHILYTIKSRRVYEQRKTAKRILHS